MENFDNNFVEKKTYFYNANIYDFQGIFEEKKLVNFFDHKGPPYDFRMKNYLSWNPKFF